MLNNRGNWTLIGLLVAVAIVVVAFAVYMGGGGPSTVEEDSELLDQSSQKQTVYGKAIDTAKDTECQERLRQIRLGIVNYKAVSATEQNPPTLKDIGLGVSTNYYQCPVSGQPYSYDPATGQVKCQNPSHADY